MSFKCDFLTAREIEIAFFLKDNHFVKQIEQKTGLSKKILQAHIRSMLKKLKVNDLESLISQYQRNFSCCEQGGSCTKKGTAYRDNKNRLEW